MRSIWRTMHSRDPMRPAFHSSSMARQAASANRSRIRSVVSWGSIVPSKSTKTWNFIRVLNTINATLLSDQWLCRQEDPDNSPHICQRTECQSISFKPDLSIETIARAQAWARTLRYCSCPMPAQSFVWTLRLLRLCGFLEFRARR